MYKYTPPAVTPPGGTAAGNSSFITIGPNPTSGDLLLQFHARGVTTVSAEVMDMAGQVVLRFDNLVTGSHLSLAGLQNGVYELKITSSDGSLRATKEVVKW